MRTTIQANRTHHHREVVTLSRPRRGARKVATLVCGAFQGPRPDGHEVTHLNGDALDNRAENLVWRTPAEKMAARAEARREVPRH